LNGKIPRKFGIILEEDYKKEIMKHYECTDKIADKILWAIKEYKGCLTYLQEKLHISLYS
jgi:hypothetical protein